ncbi:hypothetical protein ABTZ03_30860 [Kitasatospora sp. NPDC096077]|uniref:hypothetical protein n=1 Tax=Kitasatospora sp. NPDC096077 TaxID=3155544 RepID=UPI003325A1FE
MPDTTAATLLTDAFTWYSTGLRDLVRELLDEADLDTGEDTVDDLCGDLWLHAAEFTSNNRLDFTGLLDLLDETADIFVERLRHQPDAVPGGRLNTAADPVDVARLAIAAVDAARHRPVPRPHRPASSSHAFEHMAALRPAA